VTPIIEAVIDVVASYDAILLLVERVSLFLQRLGRYTEMPLTDDLTELLGKIMAQLLSVLALSTKAMTDKRISKLDKPLWASFLADDDIEKLLKKVVGRKDVEDAVSRLDILTKEENLMILVQNLEATHRVDDNVEATKVLTKNVDDNVKATKALTKRVDENIKVIGDDVKETKALSEDIGDDVKATKDGMQRFCLSSPTY
jgi:hypothetical protein